jgi:hypothetical protein
MAIEGFGGVRFNQAWDNQGATDIPPGKEPLLLCRDPLQPALALEGAPLRIDSQYGLDLGQAPFLRLVGSQIQMQAPGGLSIQTGNPLAPALTVSADGKVGVGTAVPGAKLEVGGELKVDGGLQVAGNLAVNGPIQIPKTSGGQASLYNAQLDNENDFVQGNIKLSMGSWRGLVVTPISYQFIIGHELHTRGFDFHNIHRPPSHTFQRVFSVDHEGNAFFASGKGGWVYDLFVNAAGEPVEHGDVVVLNQASPVGHYGSGDSIPIPEADLSAQAYDKRVCGIVVDFVAPHGLPTVFPKADAEPQASEGHPLAQYAGPSEGQSPGEVKDRQMGRMVTLGAYAFCKVDADIAPIEAGDLLTTSPTRGHAQKVLEPQKAVGTILGKAMAPLTGGKGKIPVLVSLQ